MYLLQIIANLEYWNQAVSIITLFEFVFMFEINGT